MEDALRVPNQLANTNQCVLVSYEAINKLETRRLCTQVEIKRKQLKLNVKWNRARRTLYLPYIIVNKGMIIGLC